MFRLMRAITYSSNFHPCSSASFCHSIRFAGLRSRRPHSPLWGRPSHIFPSDHLPWEVDSVCGFGKSSRQIDRVSCYERSVPQGQDACRPMDEVKFASSSAPARVGQEPTAQASVEDRDPLQSEAFSNRNFHTSPALSPDQILSIPICRRPWRCSVIMPYPRFHAKQSHSSIFSKQIPRPYSNKSK